MDDILNELSESVIGGDVVLAQELTQKAVDGGAAPEVILQQALDRAMDEVGRRMSAEEMWLPEVILAARAMSASVEVLRPLLLESNAKLAGTVVIGTVEGDMHDIGKNLVSIMLRGAGFEVIDLGVDVPPEQFIQAVRDGKPDLVGMSALLTTTMPAMKRTIEAIDGSGLRDSIKILVGGAPITEGFAEQIGADGYSPDAGRVVSEAKRVLGDPA